MIIRKPKFKLQQKVKHSVAILAEKPRTLFMIDSIGASLTAFFLYIVLKNFTGYFGMPLIILSYLSGIAAFFCIYSACCYFFLKGNWAPFIRAIGFANLLYCVLTTILVLVNFPSLTIFGIAYFLAEIVLVCGLVYIELSVANAIK